ncbi:hypothetical protein FE257_002945 [Aspergillus nanangensis]|uniref:TPR domain protein n=1 Tax=Aspergillus nanangensis TaxID=2582783 RepID=A0AAD4CSX5_ASPNN|nr:hypothetical protein FE257_002945 [Aspergillus nanangensis]
MFNAASRRACALTPKVRSLTSHPHLFSTRSIPRRTIHLRPSNNANITSKCRPTPFTFTKTTAITPLLQTRNLAYLQRMKLGFQEASKGIWRKNPVLLPLAILSLAGATVLFAYIAYVEYTRVGPQYHKFPPPVAECLRTAVYYTEVDLNPPKALQAYKEALRIALDMGMHPFSDEVLGIKLQVAMMLEKAGLVKPAIEVLERTKTESLNWIEEGRKKKAILVKEKQSVGSESQPDKVQVSDPAILDEQQRLKELEEFEDRQRDKALKKTVGIEMKLAELYSSDYIQEDEKAEAAQVAAVELCLKEMRRRQSEGLPVGGGSTDNDAWLNVSEIATALTDLGGTYTTQEKYDLAIPLYLRALDLIHADEDDSPSCKQVVLLNSVAGAMAGQAQKPIRAPEPGKAREQLLDAAQQWAQKSIDIAANIQPPMRDQDCDITCVVATYNLGELAELRNKPKRAEELYNEAWSLAHGIGYEEGAAMADAALKRMARK